MTLLGTYLAGLPAVAYTVSHKVSLVLMADSKPFPTCHILRVRLPQTLRMLVLFEGATDATVASCLCFPNLTKPADGMLSEAGAPH